MVFCAFVPSEVHAAPQRLSLDSRYFEPFPDAPAIEQFILEYSGFKQTLLYAVQEVFGDRSILENTLLMLGSTLFNVFYDVYVVALPYHELGHALILEKISQSKNIPAYCDPHTLNLGRKSYSNFFSYLGAGLIEPFVARSTSYCGKGHYTAEENLLIYSQGINNNVSLASAYATSLQHGTGSVFEAFIYFISLTYPLLYSQRSNCFTLSDDICNYAKLLYQERYPSLSSQSIFDALDQCILEYQNHAKEACEEYQGRTRTLINGIQQEILTGSILSLLLSSSFWFYSKQIVTFFFVGNDTVSVINPLGIRLPDLFFYLNDVGPSYNLVSGVTLYIPYSWGKLVRVPLAVEFVVDKTLRPNIMPDFTFGFDIVGLTHDSSYYSVDVSMHLIPGNTSLSGNNPGINMMLSVGLQLPWFLQIKVGYSHYDPKTIYGKRQAPKEPENIVWGRLSFDYGKLLRIM